MVMGSLLHLNSYGLASSLTSSHIFGTQIPKSFCATSPATSSVSNRGRIRAIGTVPGSESETESVEDDPDLVKFAFVSSVLLPDGTPDIHLRSCYGGVQLRELMMETNVELHGPYSRPLLNCGGGGTCGTCLVEVVEGKQLLSPRTDKEKEILKKKPKTWRLACQTMVVGTTEAQDLVVIQQMPEWKLHDWGRDRIPPPPYDDSDQS